LIIDEVGEDPCGARVINLVIILTLQAN